MPICRIWDYLPKPSAISTAKTSINATDIRRLMAHHAKIDMSQIAGEVELDPIAHQSFLNDLDRLQQGEPLAYILGCWTFWDCDLEIGPGVLIPRLDTELMIATVLSRWSNRPMEVIDAGTGSGAIALALGKARTAWQILGLESDSQAYAYAKRNQHTYQDTIPNVDFLLMDWANHQGPPVDLWVSNPPYIDPSDPDISEQVKTHEPASALFANHHGLSALISVTQTAIKHLKPGGYLILEHGWQQAKAVRQLMKHHGLTDIETLVDTQGHDRLTLGKFTVLP